jgi:hypothetical protein
MRKLKKNAQDTFRVKAYAGTNGVLLAFDLEKARKPGLPGFAIEQQTGNKPWQWLLNSLTFPASRIRCRSGMRRQANSPIQKFRWADYSVEPDATCRYRVHLACGSVQQPQLDEMLEVEVATDDGKPKDHRVFFNRAVAASQAFGRKFPDLDRLLRANKQLPIEDRPAAPRDWLQNGLLDSIVGFIGRAKDEKWALDKQASRLRFAGR